MIDFFAWGLPGLIIATVLCIGLPLLCLYQARTFVKKI